jgi:small-conductance mechanosensitive channel
MIAPKSPRGISTLAGKALVIWAAVLLVSVAAPTGRAHAQQAHQTDQAKIQLMQDLLADKAVQEWLLKQIQSAPTTSGTNASSTSSPEKSMGTAIDDRVAWIRNHLYELVSAVPRIPAEIAKASSRLRAESAGFGLFAIVLLALVFGFFGFIAEWLFRRKTAGLRDWVHDEDPVVPRQRFYVLLVRILMAFGSVAVFGAVSFGVFVIFQWPDLLGSIVIRLLGAALLTLIAYNLLNVLLSPNKRQLRYVPLSDAIARHFRIRLVLAVGWYFLGTALVEVMRLLGIDSEIVQTAAYILGLGLLAIGLELMWRRPLNREGAGRDADDALATYHNAVVRNWLYSAGFLAMWLAWVIGLPGMFCLVLVTLALPPLVTLNRGTIYSIFKPEAEAGVPEEPPSVPAALVERTLRALLIFGAVALLAYGWKLGVARFASSSDPVGRIGSSLLIVLVILLIIDLIWQLLRTLIDVTLENANISGEPGTPEAVRQAKLRTLLPITRNILMIFLITLAILMSLATLGVQIGPLIASAGVVGIAIGFGAQTFVKDVVSGMFYLLDDAFRVGEYIISGQYRGTVESFSLRSVRLRHHRGPVFTVPFGELGAIQNMSRDYVIDKFKFTVTYDTDVEKARKLLKQVGKELAEDPDLAPLILEPLKMQAIGDFGEYGLELKVKMKCRPNGQYMVRKKAYPLIKHRFDENGIEFAFPTVKIAEDAGDDMPKSAKAAIADHVITKSQAHETGDK